MILAGTFPLSADPGEVFFHNFYFETVLPLSKTTAGRNFPVLLRFLAIGFRFFHFDLYFLYGVQNSIALHTQIYPIANSFGGRQAVGNRYADFVYRVHLSNEKIRQSTAMLAPESSKSSQPNF
jgi:hypothetical protein